MPRTTHRATPALAYPKELSAALRGMGDYVYAYYKEGKNSVTPFYVGKGKDSRVLAHWKNALSSPTKEHEKEIAGILASGKLPIVKLLAYDLEETPPHKVNSVAERVLQDAFGIQSVWQKRPGAKDRLRKLPATSLMQTREDSSAAPVLSLDAVVSRSDLRRTMGLEELGKLVGAPILLVGISHTYHPSYSEKQLAEMARMHWRLKSKFSKTSYPAIEAHASPVLLAWSSKLNGFPMIVGAWRIRKGSFATPEGSNREICEVVRTPDFELRRLCLGIRLSGKGNKYQGPRIIIPAGK